MCFKLRVRELTLRWVKTEIFALANGGGLSPIKQYLRLIIVSILLTIGPSCCVLRLCTRLQTSVWPFYNAIGNIELHIEMIFLVVWFLFLQASWWFEEKYHIINNILFYVRFAESFSFLFASYLRCYYRLMSPFLTAFFWLRFALYLIWLGLGTVEICSIVWAQYKMRRELIDGSVNFLGANLLWTTVNVPFVTLLCVSGNSFHVVTSSLVALLKRVNGQTFFKTVLSSGYILILLSIEYILASLIETCQG